MDTQKSNEDENDSFETIEPEKDNPAQRELEIGELGNEELEEDELASNDTGDGKLHNNSENFNVLRARNIKNRLPRGLLQYYKLKKNLQNQMTLKVELA
jgi:hypothetical protein